MCRGDFMSKNPEEAMDFLSYVAEVSRGWDEPNGREVGRLKSQPNAPNAKVGMYTLKEDIDMKAKVATMARRLEELEMKKIREVQAISETPVQAMPCSICQSFKHLVEECPTILAALLETRNPSMLSLVKELTGGSSQMREVKAVIILRSGKEVDMPTSKPEHEPEIDKFYYPMDFVVLDTDPVAKGTNYVPLILGRPFLVTSNVIINCRNGVMQLTFGNMTLELNIFYLCKKQFHPEKEEGPKEVCIIDNLVEEHFLRILMKGYLNPQICLLLYSLEEYERNSAFIQWGGDTRSC
ncbi:hypothetical protein AAG906_027276 [Vitis piasezkii]